MSWWNPHVYTRASFFFSNTIWSLAWDQAIFVPIPSQEMDKREWKRRKEVIVYKHGRIHFEIQQGCEEGCFYYQIFFERNTKKEWITQGTFQ